MQLAQGLHEIASGTSTASAEIAKVKTVQAAIRYLEHSSGPRKGSQEVTGALTTLDRLGSSSGG